MIDLDVSESLLFFVPNKQWRVIGFIDQRWNDKLVVGWRGNFWSAWLLQNAEQFKNFWKNEFFQQFFYILAM